MIDAASPIPARPAGNEPAAPLSAGRRSGVKPSGSEDVHRPDAFSRLDDDALVEAARHDREAFGALYDRYFDAIYAYVARRTGDAAQAEDIAATVWEKALRSIERYEVRGVPFAAWLYRIAGNQVANHHRHAGVLRFVPLEPTHGRVSAPDTRGEERAAVHEALARVSASDREVLSLCYFTELSPPEIADVLGCNVAAVHKRLHRARLRLRRLLEEDARVVAAR